MSRILEASIDGTNWTQVEPKAYVDDPSLTYRWRDGPCTYRFMGPPTEFLEAQLKSMESYLRLKLNVRDWHGVADAAMDIRELEAVLKDRRLAQ